VSRCATGQWAVGCVHVCPFDIPEKTPPALAAGSVLAGIGYASIIERNGVCSARGDIAGAVTWLVSVEVLHIRDIHMLPKQRRKQAWLRELARFEPDWSSTPATTCRTRSPCPPSCRHSATCCRCPGVFVFGSNDYFGPRLKNPANYLTNRGHRVHGEPLPWQDLRAAFTERGWLT